MQTGCARAPDGVESARDGDPLDLAPVQKDGWAENWEQKIGLIEESTLGSEEVLLRAQTRHEPAAFT